MPVVVLKGATLNLLVRDTRSTPRLARLNVALRIVGVKPRSKDRHPDAGRVEAQSALFCRLSDELPCVLNGLVLEVVTEGEIPQHLEESAVTSGLANLINV